MRGPALAAVASPTAWLYRKDITWQQQPVVLATSAGMNDDFGSDVALSADGRRLAVGAEFDDAAGAGDLLVTFDVIVPTELDDTGRQAVEALASALPGNPREYLGV